MAIFNNFKDIKKYIDESIDTAQLPDKIRGVVSYSASFNPTLYTGVHEGFKPLDVWINISTNVYFEFNGSSWQTSGNLVPREGDYIYSDRHIEGENNPVELSYSAQILWSKVIGKEVLGWKIIRDRFYAPDEDTINLDVTGRLQLATQLLRGINNLSVDKSGHSSGLITLTSGNDNISITPISNFLGSRGKQTILEPVTNEESLDVKTFGGGAFKVGGISNEPYMALYIDRSTTNTETGRKLLITATALSKRVLWEQEESGSSLHQNIGGGVTLITDSQSMYPQTDLGRNLGKLGNSYNIVFTKYINNGQNITIPNKTGTLAVTSDIPASLKNPYSLTLQLNGGATEGTNRVVYDGSGAKSLNITPALIGASETGHTHSEYLLKAGDFMTGDLFHNSGTRSVWSTGQGESTKQGEISASTGIFYLKALTSLIMSAESVEARLVKTSFSPTVNGSLDLGTASARWKSLFVNEGNINNDLTVGGTIYSGGLKVATEDWSNTQLATKLNSSAKGEKANKTLTWGGTFKVLETLANGTVNERTMTMPANPDTDKNNYLTGVSGSGNGTVTFTRQGLGNLTWDASHTHDASNITSGIISNDRLPSTFVNLTDGGSNLPYKGSIVIYGDSNKYYPVHFGAGKQDLLRTIKIWRIYYEQAPNDWYTSTHKGSLNLEWKGNYGGWGGAVYNQWIYENSSEYTTLLAETQLVDNCYAMAFFLRGGGTTGAVYHFASDQPLTWTGHPFLTYDKPTAFYNQDLTFDNPDHARYAPAPRTTVNYSQLNSITVVKGGDSRLTNARPASDVSLSTIRVDTIIGKTHENAILRQLSGGQIAIGSYVRELRLAGSTSRPYYTTSSPVSSQGVELALLSDIKWSQVSGKPSWVTATYPNITEIRNSLDGTQPVQFTTTENQIGNGHKMLALYGNEINIANQSRITNLADGINPRDAINKSQLTSLSSLKIADVRNYNPAGASEYLRTPSGTNQSFNLDFAYVPGLTSWKSIMTMRGWLGGEGYAVWQLIGNADNTGDDGGKLHYRYGVNTTWNQIKTIASEDWVNDNMPKFSRSGTDLTITR